ncbi:hypothetical protein SteCoe_9297 [Stentor coeruleus]|uniref:Uncharacterized protein n=1 Tax=Stentor coeruleus TaxID=5963 RepID=A0A1R2CI17_9CILI|nr:hypothetical protein SteCoe_9297 [Stentor coeruleus]
MQPPLINWETPFLYKIQLHQKGHQIISQVESLLTGRKVTSSIYGLNEINFRAFLKTKSSAFTKFFIVIPQSLKLVFINGLRGGGCAGSRRSKSISISQDKKSNETSQLKSSTHVKSISTDRGVKEDFEIDIEVSAEELKKKNELQYRASSVADSIAEQMRTGVLDNDVLDELLEISPYKCINPFAITSTIIMSFDSSKLWVCDHWIEERAKISRICRKFMMADFIVNKGRAFLSKDESSELLKKMNTVKQIINKNMDSLPEICTLIEVNVMVSLIGRAKSIESTIMQVFKHCMNVLKILVSLYKKELDGALAMVIRYIKEFSYNRKKSYEDYMYEIDLIENTIDADPSPKEVLEGYINDQLSQFETLEWEKQHILIGFICGAIVKKKISIEFSSSYLRTKFSKFITSSNEKIKQKTAICIRYFIGSDIIEIKKFGDNFRRQLLDSEIKDGIKKILNLHALASVESGLLRMRTSKKIDMKIQLDKIKEMMIQSMNGTLEDQNSAQEEVRREIKDIKDKVLNDAMRKKNDLIKIICKMKSELLIKQNGYNNDRKLIINDEEWEGVKKAQSSEILDKVEKSFNDISSNKAAAEIGMKEVEDGLNSKDTEEKKKTFSILITVKQLYAKFLIRYDKAKAIYNNNSQARESLKLTKDTLVQKILDSPLEPVDFGGPIILTEQKERHIDLWYNDVESAFEDLNFGKIVGSGTNDFSLFDEQIKKYDSLKEKHEDLKSNIVNIIRKKIDDTEIFLQEYFLRLKNCKPKIMQEIFTALSSITSFEKSVKDVNESYEEFHPELTKLINRVHTVHPEIQISKSVMDKFSTDPFTYLLRNKEKVAEFTYGQGKNTFIDATGLTNSTIKMGNRSSGSTYSYQPANVSYNSYPSAPTQPNPYGQYTQPNLYTQPNPYGQPPNPYAQPNPYGQPPNPYTQSNPYGQYGTGYQNPYPARK